ncbi:hypothetical protein XSR1_310008 [Xenorhabdus szentirmaii DSM 16338]|uniref:Uncharacterized protein n=1 Tax=Xenorhabdus szentirmaii DSM 16338 TaxID=1427518 RepID=W1IYB2_9GAMM|nr:hypothetical protein XSR1_310008 [Xenorhabdus szentirmaii DSM 16338]
MIIKSHIATKNPLQQITTIAGKHSIPYFFQVVALQVLPFSF